MNRLIRHTYLIQLLIAAGLAVFSFSANAVPSFARQTGLPCSVCHTTPPELTSFGRLFKLNGYTLSGIKQIQTGGNGGPNLSLASLPPLSAMAQIADTVTRKSQPGTQNGNVQFPAQLSVFYAGAITPHVGAFSQITYTQSDDHFSFDNADIRYTNHTTLWGADTLYGLTLNDGPTIEDVWNSTGAWGFPWTSSDVAPTPAAAPLLGGTLTGAGSVAGLGAYAMWDQHVYGLVSMYRASQTGVSQPAAPDGAVNGFAPYWRVAYQNDFGSNYLEVGAYGMNARIDRGFSAAGIAGANDSYTDYAVDATYQRPFGDNSLSVYGTYIHEQQTLDASHPATLSTNPEDTLKMYKLNATYHIDGTYALTLGYFNVNGTTDTGLYAPADVTGSANGSPDSAGWIAQATYLPWENVQMTLQYTAYTKFNGASSNYDGSGRNASDNNTLFLQLWVLW